MSTISHSMTTKNRSLQSRCTLNCEKLCLFKRCLKKQLEHATCAPLYASQTSQLRHLSMFLLRKSGLTRIDVRIASLVLSVSPKCYRTRAKLLMQNYNFFLADHAKFFELILKIKQVHYIKQVFKKMTYESVISLFII